MTTFDVIAFDADDTLWHSESLYAAAQEEYRRLLAPYAEAEQIDRVLHQTEMQNLAVYGYGVKGFALSMIEAALELSQHQISGNEVQRVLDLAKQMLSTDVELIEGVAEVIAQLAATYPLMLITKGDLAHQEAKIEQSGLKALLPLDRDRHRQDAAELRGVVSASSHRSGALPHDRQLAALRYSACAGNWRAGRACAVCHYVGARARGRAARSTRPLSRTGTHRSTAVTGGTT